MPASYTLHPDLGFVATRFVDPVGDDRFFQLYDTIFQDAGYTLGMHELADLREAPKLDLSTNVLRRVAYLTQSVYEGHPARFRTALIAPGDLPFGIGRMYEVFISEGPEHVRVFREPEGAFAWLGLPALEDDRMHRPP